MKLHFGIARGSFHFLPKTPRWNIFSKICSNRVSSETLVATVSITLLVLPPDLNLLPQKAVIPNSNYFFGRISTYFSDLFRISDDSLYSSSVMLFINSASFISTGRFNGNSHDGLCIKVLPCWNYFWPHRPIPQLFLSAAQCSYFLFSSNFVFLSAKIHSSPGLPPDESICKRIKL